MKLSVLVDNHTYIDRYFLGEPAVSYYLEIDECRILFDTGYSAIVFSNAGKMGIDLSGLTHIVLSHGHNDHTNGLRYLKEHIDTSAIELIAHPDCFCPKRDGEEWIGSPMSRQEVEAQLRYRPECDPFWISQNCVFLGQIPQTNTFEVRQKIGEQRKHGAWQPDEVLDDTAVACRTDRGLFLITGCSHSGICNIMDYAMEICKEKRIAGILGGFHLFENDSRLAETIRHMEEKQVQKVYPCHCVSLLAKARMMEKLAVEEVGTGLKIEIE